MSTSDWITIGVGLGGWIAAIAACLGLVYQRRSLKRFKEEKMEQLTKEILYRALYYGTDTQDYHPNIGGTIDLTEAWIARVHQQVKQRLMRET